MSSEKKIKEIRGLIIFAAIVWLLAINIEQVIKIVLSCIRIFRPFIIGGVIAFLINIPMKFYEKNIFGKSKNRTIKRMARPLSILFSILSVLAVFSFVVLTVMPQLGRTLSELAIQVPEFFTNAYNQLENFLSSNPQQLEQLEALNLENIDWQSIFETVGSYLKIGVGSIISSSVNVASSIIGGIVDTLVAFIFSLYILSQKDKLQDQSKRILTAYFKEGICNKILNISKLLYVNFTNFITGQCLEAVILGTIFVITMVIFRMPYAMLVGVLIAFTALIPIVGAFIGCFVGTFLILVDSPEKAIWFLVLFLVLQQIEGQLIYPRVVGNSVGLPSIWVLVAVSVGGSIFGVPGILLFIPLFSTFYIILREDVKRRNLEKLNNS